MLEKIDKMYCDICNNLYFGILKIFHLDYFSFHNIQ